ncbi:CHAT domain-containing protein [Frankia sp. AiPa1]|nr:CHAT domain-containing protein [Frankia sp. AiPa1]
MRAARLSEIRDRVRRFNAAGEPAAVLVPEALDEVVDLLCSIPDPAEDAEVAHEAAWLFWLRFAAGGATDDTELMVALDLFAPSYLSGVGIPELICKLFDDDPPALPDGSALLARLGRAQFREALKGADGGFLSRGIELFRRSVAVAGPEHADYAVLLTNLGSALMTRFEQSRRPADLEEAVKLTLAAVTASSPDDPAYPAYLSNLGNAFLARFKALVSEADLAHAIEGHRLAVTTWPDHPDHASMAHNLDLALRTQAAFRAQTDRLDQKIDEVRGAAGAADGPSPAELTGLLFIRFQQGGDPTDLEDAILVCRAAAVATGDASLRAEYLSGLGELLRTRFIYFGDSQDLSDAVAYGREAVTASPAGDPGIGGRQADLAVTLTRRYQTAGVVEDLVEAAALGRSAVTGCDRPAASDLANLCYTLRTLFERTGWIADLDEAVGVGRAAVEAAAEHTLTVPACLGNLGVALIVRARHTGSQADLDEAIDALRRSVLAIPAASPDRATALTNLGAALVIRFDSTGLPEDLDEAIDTCREAVRTTTPGQFGLAARLTALASALEGRFRLGGDPADLDEAVESCRHALETLAPGQPGRAAALTSHAVALLLRHDLTDSAADLDMAVDSGRASAAELAADHPDRAAALVNLGQTLRRRHARTGVGADLDGALAAAREAAAAETGRPRDRAVAAVLWGGLAATDGRWADAVAGYAAAVDLVARTVPRNLARHDQELLLDGLSGIASDAAACCVRAGSVAQAVELFEQGRGLLLSQALDSRTDVTALAERRPELADRFVALCTALDATGPGHESDIVARREMAAEFDRLVADIRMQSGFERFLRPPSARDLAPDTGYAVIVTVSRFGSYALVLAADGEPMAVPLPCVTPDAVWAEAGEFLDAVEQANGSSARTRELGKDRMTRTLSWMWDAIAGPVLGRIGLTGRPPAGEPWPRLWWCTSGLLSFLPLPAAGHHGPASDPTPLTVIDRAVSSIAPTLRAIAYSRRAADAPRSGVDRAVVVAMPTTPGTNADLPGAAEEATLISRYFGGEVDILTTTAATHEAVLTALPGARWAHFACHGHSDVAEPSASRLLLADHHKSPLTVVDVARLRMDDVELAFLSACSTARPGDRLADEVIHLASAFQLAGYRHVIGTLWPVGDLHAVDVASLIYAAVADGTDIAAAVHRASCRMRDLWPGEPGAWAAYLHVGA